jgi:hypothetical protein
MPLTYDDIPGSWGAYSQNWPSITFTDVEKVRRAFVACSKEKVVPYGSYVLVGLTLRVETDQHKANLLAHLAASTLTSDEVIAKHGG